mgnify:CR=1 FL=1|jgi:hypothetical protein
MSKMGKRAARQEAGPIEANHVAGDSTPALSGKDRLLRKVA